MLTEYFLICVQDIVLGNVNNVSLVSWIIKYNNCDKFKRQKKEIRQRIIQRR